MANLPRKLQKILGASLTPTGNLAKFGSLKAGSPAYSSDLDQIQTAEWVAGWPGSLINAPGGLSSPALQDMNSILYVLTTQLAYILQKGMPDWLTTEEYFTDDMVKVGGVIYISKQNNNSGKAPASEPDWWKTLQSTLGLGVAQARAWVCFNGATGTIYSSHNVSSITRTAAGRYVINFTTALPNALYAFSGSCGTPPGQPWSVGDDNVVVGGVSGATMIKTTTQLTVFTIDQEQTQDSKAISVMIFGTD